MEVVCDNCGYEPKAGSAVKAKNNHWVCPSCFSENSMLKSDTKKNKFDYYIKGFTPYQILRAYPHIVDPAHQHAIKKLLRAGKSIKSLEQDIDEVIDSLVEYRDHLASVERKQTE